MTLTIIICNVQYVCCANRPATSSNVKNTAVIISYMYTEDLPVMQTQIIFLIIVGWYHVTVSHLRKGYMRF
jgi:hypothetical protein